MGGGCASRRPLLATSADHRHPVGRGLKSTDVIDVLPDLFILRGVSGPVRSDNAPEFIGRAVREWIAAA